MPSITDEAFDKSKNKEKQYDIIYIARDHKEDIRYKFAVELDKFCKKNNLKLKLFGSLGNPPVFGQNYYDEISKSKIAINFNRDEYLDKKNENKVMESSDRMNHFLGVGVCTFTPEVNEMDRLFKNNKEIVYFIGVEDCFNKIKQYLSNRLYEKIGASGSRKAYEIVNAKRVTKYMIEVINNELLEKYEWDDYIFKNGVKLQEV
ncbi:glycosyltransferase [Sulfurovum sp. AR]|uniref:glycosyltransferase n=1 Tax=Sulfurovum sp. AR TaxID=1165841 RepID=UPI0002E4D829|nr:glycosyltransferase [Sulfurovum sp. AR]